MAESKEPVDPTAPVAITIMFIVMGVAIWWRFRSLIVWPLFTADQLIYSVWSNFGLSEARLEYWQYVREVLATSGATHTISVHNFLVIQTDIGMLIRLFCVILMFTMVVYLMFSGPKHMMTRRFSFRGGKYGMQKFMFGRKVLPILEDLPIPGITSRLGFKPGGEDFFKYQAQFWESSITSAYFDQYEDDPNWRQSDNELHLAIQAGVKMVSAADTADKLEAVLMSQLTTQWHGIRKAPVHCQAIAALAVASRKRNLNKLAQLCGELARCALPHQPLDEEGMAAAIKPWLTDKAVEDIDRRAARHAFLKTAMLCIYGYGHPIREWGGGRSGILAPSYFLWLRGVDRGLWYTLQSVGRPSFFAEACGVVAHYKLERLSKAPRAVPFVAPAVEGVIAALKSHGVEDVEEYRREMEENMT